MTEITLDENEQRTVSLKSGTLKATNILHIQNVRDSQVFWSTSDFSDTNRGFELKKGDERYFTSETEIYIRGNGTHPISVQISNVEL
jgi:hypothetical protein